MAGLIAGLTLEEWRAKLPLLDRVAAAEEVFWLNPRFAPLAGRRISAEIDPSEIDEAARRLQRFAPYLARVFPETGDGLIESPLKPLPKMRPALGGRDASVQGGLYLKCDSHLPIAGSVKARGGIYEVLKTAEEIARREGGLGAGDDYAILAEERFRRLFAQYKIAVGSTGNLGLSIGLMGALLGFEVTVHMSADAQPWKKSLLREKGAQVIEYEGDYSEAVAAGRREAEGDPKSHFVDDENSKDLFLGYAVAAGRLKTQLDTMELSVNAAHPLFVYLPCGVGGAPGGLTYGLRTVFGDAAHCFFAEPTQAPAMLLGLMTCIHQEVSGRDFGLETRTAADGLAVARPSGFVGRNLEKDISGVFTVQDRELFRLLRLLRETEDIFLEPSALAGFPGPGRLENSAEGQAYLKRRGLERKNIRHLVWATGGGLVPPEIRQALYNWR